MGVPCKGCENRHQACHCECSLYKDWKEQADAEREKIRKIKDEQSKLNERMLDGIKRMKHSKRKRSVDK